MHPCALHEYPLGLARLLVASWCRCTSVTQASLFSTQLCSVKGARCMRPVAPYAPPPAMTMVLNLGGTARLSPAWRAASAPRGLCSMVCRVRRGRGEGTLGGGREPQGLGDKAGTRGRCAPFAPVLPSVIPGGVCLEPASCPCESGGSFFPPGTVLQKDCGNW